MAPSLHHQHSSTLSHLSSAFIFTAMLMTPNLVLSQSISNLSSKTVVLVLGTPSILSKSNCFTVINNNSSLLPSHQVKSLGVILNSTISFQSDINITLSLCFHLCNISRLCPPPKKHRHTHTQTHKHGALPFLSKASSPP